MSEFSKFSPDGGTTKYDVKDASARSSITSINTELSTIKQTVNSAVQSVKIGTTEYKNGTNVVLPNYPTTLPASDVHEWAKASTKPSYSASEVGAISTTSKGVANGVAELDSSGKVPSSQLPSYVDDVVEGYYYNSKFYKESAHTTEISGEAGKIYVDLSTNKTYRWSGTAFVVISETIAIGETSTTAYRGDRGATAYTHATDPNRLTSATSSGLYKVSATNHGHIESLTPVEKSDITALGIPGKDTTYSTATQSANGLMSSADKTKLDGVATGATANTGTVTKVSTGSGLTGGDITSTGTVKANLRSETKLTNDSAATTETSGRVYPVALDKSGYLAVNVPWSDTKVKLTDSEPSNSSTLNCIPFSRTHNGTAVELNSNSAFGYYGKNGSASEEGSACLSLGNSIAKGTENNKTGSVCLYSENTGYGYLKQSSTEDVLNHYLPAVGGTLLNEYSGTAVEAKKDADGNDIRNKYVNVFNSHEIGADVDNKNMNDLALAGNSVAMVRGATDNPQGSAKWCHALSLAWSKGTNTSWVSQLAFGVEGGNGLWYRTSQTAITGTSWKRILDSSNYDTYAAKKSEAIKLISRNGTTFTATRCDGTTFTFDQKDDNTWTAMVGATSSANGSVGYVNAVPPKDGYNTKYLRADGTWAIPPDNNTKVTSVTKNPTTATTYSVPFSPDNPSNDNIFINDGLRYIVKEGTASSEGLASFRVGNATATGTAGNKSGDIRIFNGTGKSVVLTYANGGGTSYYQFRNTGGNAEPYTLLDSGVDIRNSYARKFSLSGSDTASTSGWYQIAEATITGYSNCHGVFAIYNTYQKETQFGIFKISLRCNNTSNTLVNDFTWVTRENGWTYDYICYVVDGNKVKLYVYQDVGQYGRIMAELLSESSITSGNSAWTMVNSTSPTGGSSMSSKVYPVERCFGAGTKTISTASAKSVTIKIKGTFFRSGTQFYTAGLLKFHFNTAKLTSTSYTYGDYTYGSYNISGNDSWIAVNGTSVTTLGQITSTIDDSSDTTSGAQTREVTLTIALSSSSFVTVEYDPQVYTVSQ